MKRFNINLNDSQATNVIPVRPEGNAPVMKPLFGDIDEPLNVEPLQVAKTKIGKHTLEMIEYFMDKTRGMLPVSLTDTQSPLNIAGQLLPLDQFFLTLLTEPEKVISSFFWLCKYSLPALLDISETPCC